MRILVAGAGGQLGSAFCRLGVHTPFEIVGMGSQDLDIGDERAIEAVLARIKPDVLINAAAYTAVDKAEQEQELAYRINAKGPGYLARMASMVDIPLLHFSTDYVFDGSKEAPYLETDTVAPLGVYGATKLAGERAIQLGHSKHLIFRTSWVFGLEGHNFPKTMLRLAAQRTEIRVVADQYGCPTFADDIVRAVFEILGRYQQNGSLPWGLFHYAGQPSCSWYEFATYILGMAFETRLIASMPVVTAIEAAGYPVAAKRPANSRLDCSKFTSTFTGVALSNWGAGVGELTGKTKRIN